jgi:hypothetical protein
MDMQWLHNQVRSTHSSVITAVCFMSSLVLQALRLPKPPALVAHLYTQEEFERKRSYNLDKLRYGGPAMQMQRL